MVYFSGKFISASYEYCTLEKHIAAPMFRKRFTVQNTENCSLTICGLGFYELFINGKRITKGKLAPYVSNPQHIAYYDSYDLSPYLLKGENVIGVILGNGFVNPIGGSPWYFDKAFDRCAPKLALALIQDDEVLFEATDGFLYSASPITFDDERYGEYYDATNEQKGWAEVGFDASDWKKPILVPKPLGEKKLCPVSPIRCKKEIAPVNIIKSPNGYIYDFGVNTAGVCRLKIKGEYGQKIILDHGEVLDKNTLYKKNVACPMADYTLQQKDIYIAKGEGVEVYEPYFTYHGFRYVEVSGISQEQATYDLLTMLVYHSDVGDTSSFKCDNNTVNRLQEMTLNSDLSNLYYFPTDCPQREKNGWSGDIALSAEQYLYNMDCAKELKEWLCNFRKLQRDSGELPGIAPSYGWGFEMSNGPAWDYALFETAYEVYRFTGDKEVLQENYNAMLRYMSFLNRITDENGIVVWNGLGDWCECGTLNEWDYSTPKEVTDMLFAYMAINKFITVSSQLNCTEHIKRCAELAAQIKHGFTEKWLNADKKVSCKTQTAQALMLASGILDKRSYDRAFNALVQFIHRDGDKMKVGVLGARYMFRLLAENGEQDLALKLITQEGFPGFKYWIDNGYTALGESFDEIIEGSIFRKDGGKVNSYNHHFWGDISAFFYTHILGISVNPDLSDCNTIIIRPKTFKDINYACGTYSRGGKILKVKVTKVNGRAEAHILQNDGFNIVTSDEAKRISRY